MKNLVDYINEALEDQTISNLEVVFSVGTNSNLKCSAPSTFSNDELIGFIEDKLFNELPAGESKSEKMFGINKNEIIDVHFEYSSINKINDGSLDFEFDNKYTTNNYQDSDLSYFEVHDLRYIINFNSFVIKTEGTGDIKSTLEKIFQSMEKSEYNNYSVSSFKLKDISFDEI